MGSVWTTVLTIPSIVVGCMLNYHVGSLREPPVHQDFISQIPQAVAVACILHTVALGGSQFFRAIYVVLPFSFALSLRMLLYARMVCPISNLICYTFILVAPAAAVAVDFDPFDVIDCPVRLPLLTWISFACAMIWMKTFQEFGEV